MAKKKAARPETKSDFLRKVLARKADLDHRQVNRKWAEAGHPGEISSPLYYKVRAELGIKTVWTWGPADRPGKGRARPAEGDGGSYQWKVTLLGLEPPIWRRIQTGDGTLDDLHEDIQAAMGWTNSHLHHFRIGGQLYGDPRLLQENFGSLGYADSTATRVRDVVPADASRFAFEYEYDFGDGWEHEVLFEGRPPAGRHPLCLEGARACPPEDVGGVWGYADFLEAIGDPAHESHRDLKEWIGRKFDPEAFSPAAATRRMKRGLPGW